MCQQAWATATAYEFGQTVSPGNGYVYDCTAPGTSGGTVPTWPTVLGATVTDGTVTWVCARSTGIIDQTLAANLETTLASQAAAGVAGVTSVSAGGVTTSFDPAEARNALSFFEARAARRSGRRRRVRTLDLRHT
jgi:hypothetical protein